MMEFQNLFIVNCVFFVFFSQCNKLASFLINFKIIVLLMVCFDKKVSFTLSPCTSTFHSSLSYSFIGKFIWTNSGTSINYDNWQSGNFVTNMLSPQNTDMLKKHKYLWQKMFVRYLKM